MTRAEMLAELRGVIDDTVSGNYRWTDVRLLAYLAEGQDKFCEETGYFVDKTNFSITLEEGTATYIIPDRIIQILEVWDGTRKLQKALTGEVFEGALAAGDPAKWLADQETGTLEFDREPSATEDGDVFTLRVWRYSRYALDASGKEPEISSRFHLAPIEWAAYKALNNHDMDYQDKIKAIDHLRSFEMYITDGRDAFRRYHNIETRVGTDPAYRT